MFSRHMLSFAGAAGFVRGHPHWTLWMQMLDLVQAGVKFSREQLPSSVPGHLPSDADSGHCELSDGDVDVEKDELISNDSNRKRRESRSKQKRKPRPSTPTAEPASTVKANLGLFEVGTDESDVHSSQRKITVVLGANESDNKSKMKSKKPRRKKKTQSEDIGPSGGLE